MSKGAVIWLTGLSASGKSTLASGAQQKLVSLGISSRVIDGDVLRHTVCRDLGYSDKDRCENIRRAGELAISVAQTGVIALVALISPFEHARKLVQERCENEGVPFALVWVNASLTCCESRDPKGLYRLARNGEMPNFTGISSPYEAPVFATLVVHTSEEPVRKSIDQVTELAICVARMDPSFWVAI